VDAARTTWEAGVERELDWWRSYLDTGGLAEPDGFRFRFDPDAPLHEEVARLLPGGRPVSEIRILDCAAGPATTLGKLLQGERFQLIAVDALAGAYSTILSALDLRPPVPSRPCEAERLDTLFEAGSFDLVYMRFALDHCYDPPEALRQMERVTRPGGAILVEHYRDQGEVTYQGLRQWTLEPEPPGDLVIANRTSRARLSRILPSARIEVDASPDWLTAIARLPALTTVRPSSA
jgi:SAM-dependent methyltransferase